MKNKKGFTLVELLAVIAIMAILAVAAISGYSTMTRNSKHKAYESKVGEIENAAIKFAKETNLTTSTTISVNRLVVQGYLQPDESTADGLASITNPENGENMICNIVNISIEDDVYIADYSAEKKDCTIAEQDLTDLSIRVSARELENNIIGNNLTITSGVTEWTSKDVVLTVSSSEYTDFTSISYDFDGRTVTKLKGTTATGNTYDDSDYNRIAIKDVKIMFNSEVTITYNMSDGSSHSRVVVVRIDKENPTVRAITTNDVTSASTKKIDVYLDDANGSGVKGFYVSTSPTDFPESAFIGESTNRPGKNPGDGKFNGYNSYFYGAQATYYVKVVDNVGNFAITPGVKVSNFNATNKTCVVTVKGTDGTTWSDTEMWYNKDIKITGKSTSNLGSMGVKYVLNHFNSVPPENKLNKFYNGTDNSGILSTSVNQTEESDQRKYYLAMKGLGKDENISYCVKELGVDKTKPTVSFACKNNDCNTYKKKHTITITLKDDRSGFYESAKKIKVGWSNSKTTAPTSWKNVEGGVISNYNDASGKTIVDGQVVFNTDVSDDSLTGTYYIWVQGASFTDKAHNKSNNSPSTFSIKYDNTPPECTSSGGSDNWYNVNRYIKGTCNDPHSGCAKHAAVGKTTYDESGNPTKLYDQDIESTVESPGEVYDKAGNHQLCPANQTVKRDTVKPKAPTMVMTHSYNSGAANGSKAVVYTSGTWVNSSVTTAVYMTDARYDPFRGPTADDDGTIKSGIKKYQISKNNSTWVDYLYNYSNDMYAFSANNTYKRYVRSVDNAGNISDPTEYTIKIDKTLPACSATNKTTTYTNAGASFNVHCTDSGGSKLSKCDGTATGDVDSYDKARTGIKATASYTAIDQAGNTNTCEIAIVNQTYYRYRTRSWNLCRRGHPEYYEGGYVSQYSCWYEYRSKAYFTERGCAHNCPAGPGACLQIVSNSVVCNYSVQVCGYVSVWDNYAYYYPNTCEADWDDYGNWSEWGVNNYCTATDGSCDDESELRYKNA